MEETLARALRDLACPVYQTWLAGNHGTAAAMLSMIELRFLPYVIFTLTVMAINEGRQREFSRFIEGLTL